MSTPTRSSSPPPNVASLTPALKNTPKMNPAPSATPGTGLKKSQVLQQLQQATNAIAQLQQQMLQLQQQQQQQNVLMNQQQQPQQNALMNQQQQQHVPVIRIPPPQAQPNIFGQAGNNNPQGQPRIGGTDPQHIPWTGGSNLPANRLQIPLSINQYCPLDYRSAKTASDAAKAGLDDDLCLGTEGEKDKALFTTWIKDIKAHMEEYGMDTVFRIMEPTGGTERYLLEEWGLCDFKDWITLWVSDLKQGVPDGAGGHEPPCPFDIQNLTWS